LGGVIMDKLKEILDLVGPLKDSDSENSAVFRFRKYLADKINDVETIKLWVNECLKNNGNQFNRALQDIVNHIGELLGFDVEYGRYKGVQGVNGYDGLWESDSRKYIIVETKTTNAYTIKTSQILKYKNDLVSESEIKDKENILGVYVIGKKETKADQLKNSIIAENREKELRMLNIYSLLNLLEIKKNYKVPHEAILSIILPSGPEIDPYIDLISDLLNQEKYDEMEEKNILENNLNESVNSKSEQKTFSSKIEDYTGRSLKAYMFKGTPCKVSKWRELLKKLCKNICEDKPEEFEKVLKLKGRTRQYFSYNPENLRKPSKTDINKTGIYHETNLSANRVVKICNDIIDLFDYPQKTFKIEVEEDG
jgi:hypothetical protein